MKKLLVIALSLTCSAVSSTAFANETVFSCFMKNGKHLSIQKVGNNFRYNYGHPNKPETTFTNKIENVDIVCYNLGCSLDMSNKGVEYRVYNDFSNDVGLIISKNGKTLSDTKCNTKRKIYSNRNYF